MASEASTVQPSCGCKGIRFCSSCIHTERVKKLRTEECPYSTFTTFVFSRSRGCAVRFNGLGSSANLEEISEATSQVANVKEGDETIAINGLLLVEDFLSAKKRRNLSKPSTRRIGFCPSQGEGSRFDYGPQVNFKHKKVKMTRFVGMPDYADLVLNKMSHISSTKLGSYQPFELCNLEYDDDRMSAIEMHQDDMWIWGNRLISLNLINGSVMTLVNETEKRLLYVLMTRRSLLCMADDARYQWKHGVYAKHIRGRRIALTMREPAPAFQEGGELYEKFGKELIRLGNVRLPCR
ncbi:hypothetical protein L596_023539 [Steinernema carpocapsae]|uniref:Fe2OG dioxygenase domain-containing protein n=1 Tax=Steinernema carpocapsae TaxID=34508 RepID=A0A4U5ME02_STECR|nr:hypothetical protein L596_023539 [Steinernema carpocapsae]